MVAAPFVFLLAAVTLKQDTPLRESCEGDAPVTAQGKAGEAVEIRFALGGACYKIATLTGAGFVRARDLDGLESFDKARAGAASVSYTPPPPRIQPLPAGRRADPAALAQAGIAAWRSDNPRQALEYLRASLDLRPDPALQQLYEKVQRELAEDRSGEKSIGGHISLRYEGEKLPPQIARETVDALDAEYSRIALHLGCRTDERITAVIQSRDAYLRTTGAAQWSGGQFDGKIRVALLDSEPGVGPRTRQIFAHELVHACLASLGQWPLWFHEGMAQRLSGEQLHPQVAGYVKSAKSLPRLEQLNTGDPALAYGMALMAVNLLYERYSAYGIRNVLNNPAKFSEIQTDINRAFEKR